MLAVLGEIRWSASTLLEKYPIFGRKVGHKQVEHSLIFERGSDLITHAAEELNWGQYKINSKEDKIGVFVSLVSTKVPFKGSI